MIRFLYGRIEKEEEVTQILDTMVKDASARFSVMLNEAKNHLEPADYPDEAILKKMEDELQTIARETAKICLPTMKHSLSPAPDRTTELETEQQKEQETEKETEKQMAMEISNLHPYKTKPWKGDIDKMRFYGNSDRQVPGRQYELHPSFTYLQEMLNLGQKQPLSFNIGYDINVSAAFMRTYFEQEKGNFMSPDVKPIYTILMIERQGDYTRPRYEAYIVTPEEAEFFSKQIAKKSVKARKAQGKMWVMTPRGFVSAGTDPLPKVDDKYFKEYQNIMERILFFNADCDLLAQTNPMNWLRSDTDSMKAKIEYLGTTLARVHPDKQAAIDHFITRSKLAIERTLVEGEKKKIAQEQKEKKAADEKELKSKLEPRARQEITYLRDRQKQGETRETSKSSTSLPSPRKPTKPGQTT